MIFNIPLMDYQNYHDLSIKSSKIDFFNKIIIHFFFDK